MLLHVIFLSKLIIVCPLVWSEAQSLFARVCLWLWKANTKVSMSTFQRRRFILSVRQGISCLSTIVINWTLAIFLSLILWVHLINASYSCRWCSTWKSPVDHLAEVVETFVCSSHQSHGDERDTSWSTELPDPTIDLDIYALPKQVHDRILLHQRPNHFLRCHDLSHFTVANDTYIDEDEHDLARRYFSVGTK